MVKFSLGSSNYLARTSRLLAENCFLVEIIFQIFLWSSPVSSRGFHLSGVLYRGDSQLARGMILLRFFTGKITGEECSRALRLGAARGNKGPQVVGLLQAFKYPNKFLTLYV